MENIQQHPLVLLLLPFLLISNLWSLPVDYRFDNETLASNRSSNETPHDLYIIRTTVYEIGILTDSNDTNFSDESNEEINLTFHNLMHNGSAIDLSNIPVPIQTNISGQVITGVALANLGLLPIPPVGNYNSSESSLSFDKAILPNVIVSQTANASISDAEINRKIIENLPAEMGI